MMIVDEKGTFVVVPTLVEGSSTSKEFVVSSAACAHSDCFSCVSEDGCGYCMSDPSRAQCMSLDSASCPAVDGAEDQNPLKQTTESCAPPSIELTGPNPHTAQTPKWDAGETEVTVTWDKTNIGGSLSVQIKLVTDSYECSDLEPDDCTSRKEIIVSPATPNSGSWAWKVGAEIPSNDDW